MSNPARYTLMEVLSPVQDGNHRKGKGNLAVAALITCIITVYVLAGCDEFTFYGQIDNSGNDQDQVLEISPVSATVPVEANLIFSCIKFIR